MRFIVSIYLFVPTIVFAIGSSGFVDGVWFSTDPLVNSTETVVYAVLHNQTEEMLDGIATLIINGDATVAQEVRISAGDIQKVDIPYTFDAGVYTVAISFTASNGSDVTLPRLPKRTVTVFVDTDGDSIPDKDDADDDNDGLLDTEDQAPLEPDVSERTESSGFGFLERVTENGTASSTETAALINLLRTVEEAREKSAAAVKEYEQERREELALLKEQDAQTEGATKKEESALKEQQLAAAGAATLGFMLDKKFVFYAEIVVLSLGALHLLWVWIKSLLRKGEEEMEE